MLDLVAFCVALPFDRNPDQVRLSALLEMRQQSKGHFDIDDNCKIFLGNLGLVSDPYLRGWLHGHGWSFPIPP